MSGSAAETRSTNPPSPDGPSTRVPPAAAAALVLAAGFLTAFGPYWWSDGWATGGPTLANLFLDLMPVFPFALLATLASDERRMSTGGVLATTGGLIAATVAMQRFVLYSLYDWAPYALLLFPLVLMAATFAAYAVDLDLKERRAALAARGETSWLRRAGSAPSSNALLAVLMGATLALPLLGRALGVGAVAAVETFVVLFASIVVEALPFVLLGALVSAVLEVYVSDRVFARAAGLPLRLQVPGAVLGGFAFPVCECGSVPVARRLILRGMHPAAGLAFMLASPILNPIVLLSTLIAYQGRGAFEMTAGRAGLGIVLAITAGLLIGRRGAALLRPRPVGSSAPDALHEHDHGGGHEHGGSRPARRQALVEHLAGDFLFMGKFVVAGSALAAMLQTAIPQSAFSGVLASPFVGSALLMGVAFVLSLCSEADAFVAVSFIQFPLSAQLAFLVFGPVLDIKLALLYGATFGRRFVVTLALVAVPVVLAGVLLFQVVTS